MDGGQKRSASSPAENDEEARKSRRNTSPAAAAIPHTAHASVLNASEILLTPVSNKQLRATALSMPETEMDLPTLHDLYTRLEVRLGKQEQELAQLKTEVKAKDDQIQTLVSQNASLLTKIPSSSESETGPTDTSSSASSSSGTDASSGAASSAGGVPMDISGRAGIVPPPPSSLTSSSSLTSPVSATPSSTGSSGTVTNPQWAPLEQNCKAKVGRFNFILRTLFNHLPDHGTTLFLGDSLQKGLKKRELDKHSGSIRIRSEGGLCVIAMVHSLLNHKEKHPQIKKVVYTIGVNDYLHRRRHCADDFASYFKALQAESHRIFPNATLHFVIPYKGMVSEDTKGADIQPVLQKMLSENCPKIRVHVPPNLDGKLRDDGIHPSESGNIVLTKWYSKVFVPPPPRAMDRNSQSGGNSGRRSQGRSYSNARPPYGPPSSRTSAADAGRGPPDQQQIRTRHPPQASQSQQAWSRGQYIQPPGERTPAHSGLAAEIAEALTLMMDTWKYPPLPRNRFQGSKCPFGC